MKKIVRIGKVRENDKLVDIFCAIEIKDGNLSITGAIGPKRNGDCIGSCGQIVMDFNKKGEKDSNRLSAKDITFAPGWNPDLLYEFLEIWDRWHLNNMNAGCEHQRQLEWEYKRIDPNALPKRFVNKDARGVLATSVSISDHPQGLLGAPCPVCGYEYGTAWLKEELPQNVIDFLTNLPDTDKKPAWV